MKTLENNGPHTTALKELGYRQRAEISRLNEQRQLQINTETDVIRRERLAQTLRNDIDTLRIEHRRQTQNLLNEHEDEIRQTGIDPDAGARQRRRVRDEQRIAAWRARQEIEREQNVVIAFNAHNRMVAANQQLAQQVRQDGELARFANDAQNVHTSSAVQQTKVMVDRLLKISVPPEYRWNMTECSKTPGDIIMCCKLTPKGAWQMSAKYCQDESIYDLGGGIYGKVLDAVWQYVLQSPDKADLCKILKQEMEDNIGMCAQGNLTRLCNILSGYMEGIGPQESPAEVLGRKLPMLIGVEDEVERLKQAYDLLMELKIPQDQWLSWVEPLVDGSVSLKANGAGQVVGFTIEAN